MRANEKEMSDGNRERAFDRSDEVLDGQEMNARRVAVRSIAWLGHLAFLVIGYELFGPMRRTEQ